MTGASAAANKDDPAVTGEPRLTPELLATARRLLAMHGRAPNLGAPICLVCLKGWPCPSRRWAQRQLRRAGRKPTDSPPMPDKVGGGG